MIRGTTPTHTWVLPFDASLLKEVSITYSQNDENIIKKTEEDCTMEGNRISITLSQEDTLKLEPKVRTTVQLKVMTSNDSVMATKPKNISVSDIQDEEVWV
jgi:hypothetical protein